MASGVHARFAASLVAGAVAIFANTALLAGAGAVGFTTARGGLLRLEKTLIGDVAPLLGLTDLWNNVIAPATAGAAFKTGFHVFIGLLMALFYAYVLEPLLPGRPLVKGLIYALLVWLLNAFVVLPGIGEGLAGLGAARNRRHGRLCRHPHGVLRASGSDLCRIARRTENRLGVRAISDHRMWGPSHS